MKMPEPEEDKVTATGGGLRASGLLKLGGSRRGQLPTCLCARPHCACVCLVSMIIHSVHNNNPQSLRFTADNLPWYPAQRKSAWYTLMRFRLIKSGVLTFMTFTIFRGVFADKIYVPTWLS